MTDEQPGSPVALASLASAPDRLELTTTSWHGGSLQLAADGQVYLLVHPRPIGGGCRGTAADGQWRLSRIRGFGDRYQELHDGDGGVLARVNLAKRGWRSELTLTGASYSVASVGAYRVLTVQSPAGALFSYEPTLGLGRLRGVAHMTEAGRRDRNASPMMLLGLAMLLRSESPAGT